MPTHRLRNPVARNPKAGASRSASSASYKSAPASSESHTRSSTARATRAVDAARTAARATLSVARTQDRIILFLRKTDGMGLEGGSLAAFHHPVNLLVYSRRCSRVV